MMSDDAEARPKRLFDTGDDEADAAAEAALDELHATEYERRIAVAVSRAIDDEAARRIALTLKSRGQS